MNDEILTRIDRRVGTVTINRPEQRNALVPELLARCIQAVKDFQKNPDVKVIVIAATGKSFCSGGDLNFIQNVRNMSANEVKDVVYGGFAGLCVALRNSEKPTIAAINGPAVGAGCEIAISCDFRIAAASAFFSEPWIDLGTSPALGGMFLLPRLIGVGRATDMMLRGTRVGAEEAQRIGLATQTVADDAVAGAVDALAQDLARRAAPTMAVIKQGLRRGLESTYASELEFVLYAQSMLIKGQAHEEGVRALLEKRAPVFE